MTRAKLSEPQLWLLGYLKERYCWAYIQPEYPVCDDRKWRFDVALTHALGGSEPTKWAFEIEGGIWNHGAHVRGRHFLSDAEKYNTAAALGWKVFRFTPEQILKGEAKAFIEKYL